MTQDDSTPDRRRFLRDAAMTLVAARLGSLPALRAAEVRAGPQQPFGPVKQIDAGILNVGYIEAGRAGGPAVILLHGWPYDIYAFADVTPLLTARGYRVI